MSYLRLPPLIVLAFFTPMSFAQLAEYVVKPGDTLWGLATRFETTTDAILNANGLTGTDLFPGAVLKLPASSNATTQTYTVQAGDTLYDISVAFGVSVDSLIAFNDIDGSTIRPGQQLQLSASEPAPAPLTVTVEAGDTLWSLAVANETRPELIQSANNLTTETIKPGQTLIIPGRYAAVTTADIGGAAAPTVKVAPGDTLWEIARRHNTTITALMSANDLTGQTIRVGQTLKIVPGTELARAVAAPVPVPAIPNTTVSAAMVWPLQGVITSRFGYRRLRIGGSNMHNGVDIDGHTGDPIRAATTGVVSFSGWRGGFGNLVIVTNGDTDYYYAHASELLVVEGDVVGTGQTIAKVGSTGRSTGSHLHFEVRINDTPVDPLPLLEQYASR